MTSDDRIPPADLRLMGRIALAFRWGAVERCLAGNDTGCFGVEQYQAAYDREFPAEGNYSRWSPGLAERHLASLAHLGVIEVKPGVWTVKETDGQ